MKVNPVISASISRNPPSVLDHVLTFLPTANGPDELVSISRYLDLVHTFGTNYRLPGKTEDENEDYSTYLLNSLKYILDKGVPLLCASVKTAVNSAIRIYYLEDEEQPWYVCSIAHKGLPEGLEELPELISDFFSSDVIKGSDVSHTLCHILPLNRQKNSEDEWERIEGDGHCRFITLPVIDSNDPDKAIIPYLLMLEDNSLELADNNNDIYPSSSPIQEKDAYGVRSSVVMKCHGTDQEIIEEVTRINNILATLNSHNETSYTQWKIVFDQVNNQLLFISNQYVPSAAMYSVYNSGDFIPDTNISGNLLDRYTKQYAVIDIEAKASGEIGNELRVEFTKLKDKNLIRVYQLANSIELLEMYESEGNWEYMFDSEYINIKQYSDTINPMVVFTNSYFKDNVIKLFGGYDDEEFSYSDIANKFDLFIEDQDECPIDFVFDALIDNLEYHAILLQKLGQLENRNVHIITNGILDSGVNGFNPYIDLHKFIFYDPNPVNILNFGEVSVGACIAVALHAYQYLPKLDAILTKKYLTLIQNRIGEHVITPEVDHNTVYLNEVKIAGLDLESSIDLYLSSFIHNEGTQLFEDNLLGQIPASDDELYEKCEDILTYMSVAPEIIQSYSISDFTRSEGTLNLTIQVNRLEISGGTRNFYVNINL